jgi:hypothetical protein
MGKILGVKFGVITDGSISYSFDAFEIFSFAIRFPKHLNFSKL